MDAAPQKTPEQAPKSPSGSATEVLLIFLRLGLTCFGGPIAHIGYFREEFVVRRKWIDEHAYADLVALCQFLPGPASSEVGFSIRRRALRFTPWCGPAPSRGRRISRSRWSPSCC